MYTHPSRTTITIVLNWPNSTESNIFRVSIKAASIQIIFDRATVVTATATATAIFM